MIHIDVKGDTIYKLLNDLREVGQSYFDIKNLFFIENNFEILRIVLRVNIDRFLNAKNHWESLDEPNKDVYRLLMLKK